MLADIVDGDDMGVLEGGGGHGLALETLDEGGVVAVLGVEDLEGHIALEHRVGGPVDRRHPAPPEELLDIIASEALIK